jgi:cbb3-type cytochrome oxidase cytochrome c subunit
MRNGALVFLAVFVALGLSWCGFVLAPERQLGGAKQTVILNSSDLYPLGRPGEANLGLQVYRANGCAACHTEQVRQSGVSCSVVLTDAGKNPKAVSIRMAILKLNGLDREMADAASDQITAAGGKIEIHIVATGPDIVRGWGARRSVAAEYLYDYPVQLGSLRVGPDLANVSVREPDLNWQLVHLYAPASEVNGSTMPPFRYLFEVRKIVDTPSPDALIFPKGFGLPAGCEVVPKPEANELAAYLLSLRANVPLYSAPFTP